MSTLLVTGATAGLGAAVARRFVAGGWRVIITGRRADRLLTLKKELGLNRVHVAAFDMRDSAAMAAALDALPAAFREIDLLVNNAGLALGRDPAQKSSLDQWRQMIDTNVTGLAEMTHSLLPGLIDRKGAIINISSVAAKHAYLGSNVYGGTKAFVDQFSTGLRVDLHGAGVRVTSIEPGMMETEFTLVRTGGDAAASAALYGGANPLVPADVADMIWWVATLPPHVNINTIQVMPVSQSVGGFQIARER